MKICPASMPQDLWKYIIRPYLGVHKNTVLWQRERLMVEFCEKREEALLNTFIESVFTVEFAYRVVPRLLQEGICLNTITYWQHEMFVLFRNSYK